jgi:LPXTG-motif cell wall-anchored protein
MGDTLVADAASMTVTVRGGAGQTVTILRDGDAVGAPVPVTSDPFTHTFSAVRTSGSGPLGTFWRVDVADTRSLTAITNPIFLTGAGDPPPAPATAGAPPAPAAGRPQELPRTGTSGSPALAAVAVLLAAAGVALVRVERS